jgi:hypothetical protein
VAEAEPVAREAHRLTHAERAVLGEVERCMMGKSFSFPSQKLLVRATGYSPRAVKGAVAGLRRKERLVVKRVADLTEPERILVERASPLAVRNWRNNVYFRFGAAEIVGGKECPRSGAAAAPHTSLWDGRDQDRRSDHHHHDGSSRGGNDRRQRLVVVEDSIFESECRQIVAAWPATLRNGFDEGLAIIALRRRFSEGMSIREALDATEGAELEADRLNREATTTPFALVFGRCDAWRRLARAAHAAQASQKLQQFAERERRAAEVERERDVLSRQESGEQARAVLAMLKQPTRTATQSPRPEQLAHGVVDLSRKDEADLPQPHGILGRFPQEISHPIVGDLHQTRVLGFVETGGSARDAYVLRLPEVLVPVRTAPDDDREVRRAAGDGHCSERCDAHGVGEVAARRLPGQGDRDGVRSLSTLGPGSFAHPPAGVPAEREERLHEVAGRSERRKQNDGDHVPHGGAIDEARDCGEVDGLADRRVVVELERPS